MRTSSSIILKDICRFVYEVTGIDILLDTDSRRRHLVEARALYYKIASKVDGVDSVHISAFIGKHRTSFYHAIKIYDDYLYKEMDIHVNSYLDINPTLNKLISIIQNLSESDMNAVIKFTHGLRDL